MLYKDRFSSVTLKSTTTQNKNRPQFFYRKLIVNVQYQQLFSLSVDG